MTEAAALTAPAGHVDPVCGMTVDPKEAAGAAEYRGQTFYFCHPSCLERFNANPEAFLGDSSAKGAETSGYGPREYI
jgi:Cu+-exporting ATPase